MSRFKIINLEPWRQAIRSLDKLARNIPILDDDAEQIRFSIATMRTVIQADAVDRMAKWIDVIKCKDYKEVLFL